MNKKAFEWDIKTIILILIIFLILFNLTKGIASYFTESGSAQACLLSVQATTKTRGISNLGLECYTNFAGDIKSTGSKTKDKKEYIQTEVADLAYECWMQFGEGNYDVFEGKFLSKPAHCFICSKFNINEITSSDISSDPIDEQEFIQFLKDTNLPSGKSYYDFLSGGLMKKSGESKIFISGVDYKPGLKDTAVKFLKDIWNSVKRVFTEEEIEEAVLKSIDVSSFNNLERLDGNGKSGYGVVYYQVSKSYIQQHILFGLGTKAYEYLSDSDIENKIPPAYVIITPYDQITDLQCDMLQG